MAYSEYKSLDEFKNASGYTIDNIWYPRVTKIVEIKAKPALYRYYGEAASFEAAKAATENSAKEGTLIHETLQKFLVGENPPIPPSIAPAVSAAIDFIKKYDIKVDPLYIEKRICHKEHKYAGTIDSLALIGGKIGVLDIKTSQSVYRDYNLQTSAYMAVLSQEIKNLATRWIFRVDQIKTCFNCGATLRPKGGRDKIRSRYGGCANDAHAWSELTGISELKEIPEWTDDFEAFLGAKKLWEWENASWLKQINYFQS